jgi:hypothetical protein
VKTSLHARQVGANRIWRTRGLWRACARGNSMATGDLARLRFISPHPQPLSCAAGRGETDFVRVVRAHDGRCRSLDLSQRRLMGSACDWDAAVVDQGPQRSWFSAPTPLLLQRIFRHPADEPVSRPTL